jgi:hypothetical protein
LIKPRNPGALSETHAICGLDPLSCRGPVISLLKEIPGSAANVGKNVRIFGLWAALFELRNVPPIYSHA